MKRIMAVILSVLLVISLGACGKKKQEKKEAYVPPEDVALAIAVIRDGDTQICARKVNDKELKAIKLSCIYFTAEAVASEPKLMECVFATQEKLTSWTFPAPKDSAYVEAVISSVVYADGTEVACSGVSIWEEETKKNFSVDSYNAKMKKLEENAAATAQKCDAVELSFGQVADGKMKMGVNNTSGKEIKEVFAYLLWFDQNGEPVDLNMVPIANAEKTSAKTLAVDEKASYTVTVPAGAASLKGIVHSVVFEDGTVWENEYIYEWAFLNCDSNK